MTAFATVEVRVVASLRQHGDELKSTEPPGADSFVGAALRVYCKALEAVIAALPGGDGRAGVRQRRAALRLQLRHHRVGGAVALAVRLADLPRRHRRACASTPTSAPRCWSAGSARCGKKACLVVGYVADAAGCCWLLFSGALEQTKINWDVTGAVERRLDGLVLRRRHGVQRLGGGDPAHDLVKLLTGQRRPTPT